MSEPIVETRNGLVRGVIEKSSEGFDYCAFKGIPYAKPPVGELRFKDPVPLEKWTGVKDATKYGPICAQYEAAWNIRGESEDCLHLNVFTKNATDKNAKKAVMVWIHGGGFCYGFANDFLFGPDYLLRKDVILVTANYRLGVFGFLNLEDEVAPGNQGLKDQAMALKWVQENIENFGGDPDNVTIFGESAGGACVHYLTLSPLTKGLFHRAIAQSGVVFNPWATQDNPRKTGQDLCSILGKDLKNPKDIVEYLRTIDCKKLQAAQEKLGENRGNLIFGPGVDAHSQNPFLPIPFDEIAHQGAHVPYLLGYNSCEGIIFLLESNEKFVQKICENFELIMQYRSEEVLKYYNLTPKQFKRLYYKSEILSEDNREKLVDLVTDLYFVEGVHRFVKIQAEKSSCPTYLYKFSYDPGNSVLKSKIKSCIPGTCHFDDVEYLFKMRAYDVIGLQHLRKGTQSYRIMEQMTEMWTNFAKYGKPTIETSDLIPIHWLPINDGTVLRYMNIDEDLTMQSTLNIEKKYLAASTIRI